MEENLFSFNWYMFFLFYYFCGGCAGAKAAVLIQQTCLFTHNKRTNIIVIVWGTYCSFDSSRFGKVTENVFYDRILIICLNPTQINSTDEFSNLEKWIYLCGISSDAA